MIRFAFFDRDGTLLYRDPSLSAQINARVREWTGGDFSAPCDIDALFAEAGYPDAFSFGTVKTKTRASAKSAHSGFDFTRSA